MTANSEGRKTKAAKRSAGRSSAAKSSAGKQPHNRSGAAPRREPMPAPLPNVEAIREALVDKLVRLIDQGKLKGCARGTCRRRKLCTPPRGKPCQSSSHREVETTPEQDARKLAWLQREVKKRAAAFRRPEEDT